MRLTLSEGSASMASSMRPFARAGAHHLTRQSCVSPGSTSSRPFATFTRPWRLHPSAAPSLACRNPRSSTSKHAATARSYACACGAAPAQPRRKRTAYVALGSNLGDRVAEIERACREMDARGVKVKRTSSLWETEPMYVVDQDRFLNGACEVRLLSPGSWPKGCR